MKLREESEKPGLKLNIQKTKIMASNPITSWQIGGETMETVTDLICGRGLQNHCRWWLQPSCGQLGQHTKKQRHYFADKGPSSQGYGVSSSHVWMWELDYKESWAPNNWCFWTVMLKTLECPLNSKKIKPVNPKGYQSWIFIGRTDAETETPVHWPADVKKLTLEKSLMLGKIEDRWRRGQHRIRWLDGITNSMDVNLS